VFDQIKVKWGIAFGVSGFFIDFFKKMCIIIISSLILRAESWLSEFAGVFRWLADLAFCPHSNFSQRRWL
jgi:hypothetical protein